jgi:hypothetical protein
MLLNNSVNFNFEQKMMICSHENTCSHYLSDDTTIIVGFVNKVGALDFIGKSTLDCLDEITKAIILLLWHYFLSDVQPKNSIRDRRNWCVNSSGPS